jgi:hypothetical protein
VAAVRALVGRATSRPRARREHDAKSREIGSGSSPAWNRRAPRSYRSARAELIHCIPAGTTLHGPYTPHDTGNLWLCGVWDVHIEVLHRAQARPRGATLGDSQPGQAGATTADGPRAESTARSGTVQRGRSSHTPLV